MSYLEGIGSTDRTVDFWIPSNTPRTKLSSEKSLLLFGIFPSTICPDSFGADHLSGAHLASPVTYSASPHHTQMEIPVVLCVILLTPGSIQEIVPAAHHELLAHSPAHVLAQQVPWSRQAQGRS